MSDKLVFYTNPMSRGRTVRWMLEEIGQPYETRLLDYGTTMKAPEYLAINPMGKVPAITHGDAVVTEVVAICTYLAEVFPETRLIPPADNNKARADYFRWLYFVAGPLETAITVKMLGVDVSKDKERSLGYGSLDQTLGTIETALKNKNFIAGNSFSAADLVMSSYLGVYMGFKVISPNAEFERYVKLHKSRPAALRAEQIDNDLIPKKVG